MIAGRLLMRHWMSSYVCIWATLIRLKGLLITIFKRRHEVVREPGLGHERESFWKEMMNEYDL